MTSPHARAAVTAQAVAAVLALLLPFLLATPAHATGYRYWSFWKWSGSAWAYQQQGPAVYVPPDGAVDAWRFAVSPDGGKDAARPTAAGDFATVCAATPAQAGKKRIAVVLDFGTAADAPGGETPPPARTACGAVPTAASSAEVLAAVAPPLRYDSAGILCAIVGYPRTGCGDTVGNSTEQKESSGPSVGLLAGGALVAVLAAGAVWQARRRRDS
ncbi:SCO2322 family protein [Kitasatospora gansuensis]